VASLWWSAPSGRATSKGGAAYKPTSPFLPRPCSLRFSPVMRSTTHQSFLTAPGPILLQTMPPAELQRVNPRLKRKRSKELLSQGQQKRKQQTPGTARTTLLLTFPRMVLVTMHLQQKQRLLGTGCSRN